LLLETYFQTTNSIYPTQIFGTIRRWSVDADKPRTGGIFHDESLCNSARPALGSSVAFAADDDDKVPAADMAKVTAALADLGCKDPEGVKKEQEGIYEIDDAKCKMGTMDIKLDKNFSVILISRY
jgi:hypothetical protein